MKYLITILIGTLCLTAGKTQQPRILSQQKIGDISGTPVYSYLIDSVGGKKVWKKRFEYIDSIDLNRITYSSDGLKITGLMVTPQKPGKYPCIIYNRGGNRDFGKLVVANAVVDMGKLASQGYVVIAGNYRGGGGSEGMEEYGGKDINDVLNLIPILQTIEMADTSKIGMYGWSRGGMMTYIALTKTDKIDAVCVGGAVSDLISASIDRPAWDTSVFAQLIPNYTSHKEAELKKRSAIYWADRLPKNVPILMLHGNADWRVKSTQALMLALEFDKYRIPYRLKIFEGAEHGITEFKQEVEQEVINWFDRFLKRGEPLPNMKFHGE